MNQPLPLPDPVHEAARLTSAMTAAGVSLRLLGGVAVGLHTHTSIPPSLVRTYADLDVVVRKGHDNALKKQLVALGYVPDALFNRLHGHRRLLFIDPANGRQLDVFIGRFQMCHVLELDDRLKFDPVTLSPADLLLTKLQIVQLNPKDVVDAVTLFDQHDLAEDPVGDVLDTGRLRKVTSRDWGWYTTLMDNLERVSQLAPTVVEGDRLTVVAERIDRLRSVLSAAPKTPQWRIRAVAGRRAPWYDLPEERER